MDNKKKDIEVIDSEMETEGEDELNVRLYKLPDAAHQFLLMKEDTLPGFLVLVNFAARVGFAIPHDYAHQLSHMIHDGLEELTGGDPCEEETEKKEKVTYH